MLLFANITLDYGLCWLCYILIFDYHHFPHVLVSAAFTERLEKDAPSLQKLHSVWPGRADWPAKLVVLAILQGLSWAGN